MLASMSFGAGDGDLEILDEPLIASERGEGALHHPSSWQALESFCGVSGFAISSDH